MAKSMAKKESIHERMWLSSANVAAGRARVQARAEITKQVTRFWSGAWLARKRKRRI